MAGTHDDLSAPPSRPGPPLWLLLELTYRCPLHCVYCSNPTDFAHDRSRSSEPTIGCVCCAKLAH